MASVNKSGGGDSVDARPGVLPTVPSVSVPSHQPLDVPMGIVSKDPDKYYMQHEERGFAVIINNRSFDPKLRMSERAGTDVDAINLDTALKQLDFKSHIYHNCSSQQIRAILQEYAKKDHSKNDAFLCAILSHGEEGGIYGTDVLVKIDELVAPFKGDKCKSLAGKPKIFFLQACRGDRLDAGVDVADAIGEPTELRKIPTEADFLIGYSVVPGYFSWRNSSRGSWFIQALVEVLNKHGQTMDLLTMMTRVNKKVAYDFESSAAKEHMNRKKQIPCITSMLTKDVYFEPKE